MSVNFPEKILTLLYKMIMCEFLVTLSLYFPGHKKRWIGRACMGELEMHTDFQFLNSKEIWLKFTWTKLM
jgi:hypothetical protein